MDSTSFIISSCVYSFAYTVTFVLIVLRRKSSNIMKRSPKLLLISLLGGLIQTLVTFHQIAYHPSDIIQEEYKTYKRILRIRQCLNFLGHILLVSPYLLRSYRLYFIFHLDKHWNDHDSFFSKHIHRTYQSWLLKVLALCLSIWLIITILIFTTNAGQYFPGSEFPTTKKEENVSQCLYVTISFFEQIAFLYSFYMLRNVFDDFNMVRELAWVTCLWIVTPAFPFFAKEDVYFKLPVIIRNSFLWIRSCCYPIVMSFKAEESREVVTLEMIGSFEVVLQSEIGLSYFSKYFEKHIMLKGENKTEEFDNMDLLQIYMLIENFLALALNDEKFKLQKTMEGFGHYVKEISFNDNLMNFKNWILLQLKAEFGKFKMSKEFRALKREITKREIFVGRLMQTSLNKTTRSNQSSNLFSFTQ